MGENLIELNSVKSVNSSNESSWRQAWFAALTLACVTLLCFVGPRGATDFVRSTRSAQERNRQHKQNAALAQMSLVEIAQRIATRESKVPNLRDGAEARIQFANAKKPQRTKIVFLNIHGFSASPHETEPVPTNVAKKFQANLVHVRLTGHGCGSAPMGTARVVDWFRDVEEGLKIAQSAGDKVWILATSTGCTLATWLASQTEHRGSIAGMVFISPNFGARDPRAAMLSEPWATEFAQLVLGETHSFKPLNAQQEHFWTTSYPSRTLVTMQALVDCTERQQLRNIQSPTLIVSDPNDRVVEPLLARKAIQRFGSQTSWVPFLTTEDPAHHVLAGEVLSPASCDAMTAIIAQFVESHRSIVRPD